LQASEAVGHEAFAPLADGVPVADQFGGDLLIGRLIVVGSTEDEAAVSDQSLRGGAGADQHLQLLPKFGGQNNRRAKRTWHEGLLAAEATRLMLKRSSCHIRVQLSRFWRRTYETVI
jgi:hypothetical protein